MNEPGCTCILVEGGVVVDPECPLHAWLVPHPNPLTEDEDV